MCSKVNYRLRIGVLCTCLVYCFKLHETHILSSEMTGNELKQKREELGYTQVTFGIALGVAPGTVSRWEQIKDEEIPNSRSIELMIIGLVTESQESKSKKK